MQKTVLILGANGRFGRHAKCSFSWAGWKVVTFDRFADRLPDAAWGADLIINGWNPAYPDWASEVPTLTAQVIETARDTGATVLIPGNVYTYGAEMPEVLSENTPHRATNSLGKIRIAMEQAYRNAGVKTIILRAGDFIDTEASGNWFDKMMTPNVGKGRFVYPGDPDLPHAWAFLPDLTDMAAILAERADQLETFTEVSFPGYTLTGRQLAHAIADVTGIPQKVSRMSWLPLQLTRPFWAMATPLLEMRYLWDTPHSIVSHQLTELAPDFEMTPLAGALSASLPEDVNPDRFVRRDVGDLPRRRLPFNRCCRNAQAG